MAAARILQTPTLLVTIALYGACTGTESPSSLVGGYTFARDFDDERRVLRIDPSSEFSAECMRTELPLEGGGNWKDVQLESEVHRGLLELVLDERRGLQYLEDTAVSMAAETFVCRKSKGGKEFCYVPQLVVTGVSPPWLFALHSELELSADAEELIERFLLAHDACWNAGTPMEAGDSSE